MTSRRSFLRTLGLGLVAAPLLVKAAMARKETVAGTCAVPIKKGQLVYADYRGQWRPVIPHYDLACSSAFAEQLRRMTYTPIAVNAAGIVGAANP